MITLQDVSKSYPLRNGRRVVLERTSLCLPTGANVGVLGRNGAGKSTLLRLLGGIEPPDSGRIRSDVSISWPLGLASGFQGSLTGRANAHFVARIHGLSQGQIRQVADYAQEFSGLGDYFDMPFKTYSSGMKSRLAFALSMAFEFDVYLIDEIVSVGDRNFREQSKQALLEKSGQASVLMVSHDLATLRQFCQQGLLLDGGRLSYYECLDDAIAAYLGESACSKS